MGYTSTAVPGRRRVTPKLTGQGVRDVRRAKSASGVVGCPPSCTYQASDGLSTITACGPGGMTSYTQDGPEDLQCACEAIVHLTRRNSQLNRRHDRQLLLSHVQAIPSLLHTPTAAEDDTGACAYRGAVEALCSAAAQCVGDTDVVSSALDALEEVLRGDRCMRGGPADVCGGEDSCDVRGAEPVAKLLIQLLQSRHLPAQPLMLCLRLLSEVASFDPATCQLLVSLGAIEAVHTVMQSTPHAAVVQSEGVSTLSVLARGDAAVGGHGCVCGNEDIREGLSGVHGHDTASHKRPVPVGSTTHGGHAKRLSYGQCALLRQETLIDEATDNGKGNGNNIDDAWFMADVEDEDNDDQHGSETLRETQVALTVDDVATVHGGHCAAMVRGATHVATTAPVSPSGIPLAASPRGAGGLALVGRVGEMVEEQRRPRNRALPHAERPGVSTKSDLLPPASTRSCSTRGPMAPPSGLHPIDTTACDRSAMDDSLDGASVSVVISSPTASSPSSWSSTSSTSPRPHSPSLSRARGRRSHTPTPTSSSRASGHMDLAPLTITTSTPHATTTHGLRSRSAASFSPTTCPVSHAHDVWLQSGGGGGATYCDPQAVGLEAPALTPRDLCHSRLPSTVGMHVAESAVARALRVLSGDACGGDVPGGNDDVGHAGGSGVRRPVSASGKVSTTRPSVGGAGLVRPSSTSTLAGSERPFVAVPRLKLSGMGVDDDWDEAQLANGERGARRSYSTIIAVGDAGRACGGDGMARDGLQQHIRHSTSSSVLPLLSPPPSPSSTTTTINNALLVMPKLAFGDMIPADDASASLSANVRQHHKRGRSTTCTPSIPRLNLGEMPMAVSAVESDVNMSSGGQLRRGPLPVSLHGGKLEPLRPREQLRPLRSPVSTHGTSPPGGGMFFTQSPLPRPLSWDSSSEK